MRPQKASGGLFIRLNNYMIIEKIKKDYILSQDTNESINEDIEFNNINKSLDNDIENNFTDFNSNSKKRLKEIKKFYINKYSISTDDLIELSEIQDNLKNTIMNKNKSELSNIINIDLGVI